MRKKQSLVLTEPDWEEAKIKFPGIDKIKVSCMVDFAGSSGVTQEEEYQEIERWLIENFGAEIDFTPEIQPEGVRQSCDLYIFDWGGVAPGMQGLTDYFLRSINTLALDRPELAILIYSQMTFVDFMGLLEYTRENAPPNIFSIQKDDYLERVAEWIIANK